MILIYVLATASRTFSNNRQPVCWQRAGNFTGAKRERHEMFLRLRFRRFKGGFAKWEGQHNRVLPLPAVLKTSFANRMTMRQWKLAFQVNLSVDCLASINEFCLDYVWFKVVLLHKFTVVSPKVRAHPVALAYCRSCIPYTA